MASSQGIRSGSAAQSRAQKRVSKSPQKPQFVKAKKARRRKRKELPTLPPPVIIRRGKTTIRRYADRTFHRMEEAKGKTVEFVEFFTSTGHHSIQIRFQDKTALYFVIEPCFTMDRDYGDLKTGNWQSIKEWPRIRSQENRSI